MTTIDDVFSVRVYHIDVSNAPHVTQKSGVEVTHVKTGLTAKCDTHRSMHKNKEEAIDAINAQLATQALNAPVMY